MLQKSVRVYNMMVCSLPGSVSSPICCRKINFWKLWLLAHKLLIYSSISAISKGGFKEERSALQEAAGHSLLNTLIQPIEDNIAINGFMLGCKDKQLSDVLKAKAEYQDEMHIIKHGNVLVIKGWRCPKELVHYHTVTY